MDKMKKRKMPLPFIMIGVTFESKGTIGQAAEITCEIG